MGTIIEILESLKDRKSVNSRIELKLRLLELSSCVGMDYDTLESKFANELSELPLTHQEGSSSGIMASILPSLLEGFMEGFKDSENDTPPSEPKPCKGGCRCEHPKGENTPSDPQIHTPE